MASSSSQTQIEMVAQKLPQSKPAQLKVAGPHRGLASKVARGTWREINAFPL